MNKQWLPVLPEQKESIKLLYSELINFAKNPNQETKTAYLIFSRLLVNRGIKSVNEAIQFNKIDFQKLHDPFKMKGMKDAVNRILKGVKTNEKIMIYGDYDVDGTTSVALLTTYLKSLHKNLIYYIPDRYKEGYGVSLKSIDYAKENGVKLIIALDCGIKAVNEIEYANQLNIDYIICDHHTPGTKIPMAVAVLDPKRNDCEYPYKELSGCGIGFKLCQALEISKPSNYNLEMLLDFVAISIACDIVPLTGENRVLASLGLKRINNHPRPSLSILLGEKENNQEIRISDLVFQIGPKINAAGRISNGKTAVDLLLAKNENEISEYGSQINTYNIERKGKDKLITEEALQQIESNTENATKNSNVLYKKNWHKGVIGIVASRVIEKYYKPTIVLTSSGNGIISGSVRSVKGFNVYNALEQCQEHLIQFGGHKYAAGLTMKESQLKGLQRRFEEVVTLQMETERFTPTINYEAELELQNVNLKLQQLINKLEPFGPSNMTPTFITKNVVDTGKSRAVGADKTHLKLEVTDPNTGTIVQGIAFGLGKLENQIKSGIAFNIAYTIDINYWKGNSTIQLMVKDINFTDKK